MLLVLVDYIVIVKQTSAVRCGNRRTNITNIIIFLHSAQIYYVRSIDCILNFMNIKGYSVCIKYLSITIMNDFKCLK